MKKWRVWPLATVVVVAVVLTGCFGRENPEILERDWIHHSEDPEPSPTPSATPTPTPSPSPTPTPTPEPTRGDITDYYNGPETLAKYVEKFVDDGKAQGANVIPMMSSPRLEIRVASLDAYGSSVIGLCETGSIRRVTLDPAFWYSVSETQRELLMHHELGHCLLYRAHRTAVLPSGIYASVMYPIIMGSSMYLNNYDYYQEELFSRNTQLAVSQNASVTHICNLEEILKLD